jgi:hypothetical protein
MKHSLHVYQSSFDRPRQKDCRTYGPKPKKLQWTLYNFQNALYCATPSISLSLIDLFFCPEDGGSTFIGNAGGLEPDCT